MRATLTFTAAVALCLGVVSLTTGNTADAQSASQIIDKLSPTGGMTTRGIRLGSPPPAGQSSTATTIPATEAGAGGMARPPAAVRPAEANLTVPFASGSAAISPAAVHVLDQLGEALTSPKLADFKFRIEGHTDTVGSPEMNKALSEQRAASVTDYLATKFNIDRARMTPVGMGEEGLLIATGPGVPNSANRRVLVVNLGH